MRIWERFAAKHARRCRSCLAYFNGEEDEALALLAQYLQGWVIVGRSECVGCGQVRGEDSPMLRCDGCHVARYYRTTHDW